MSNLDVTISEFDAAWRALVARWEETKAVWNDPVRWDFDKEYWAPLEKQMSPTQREMERLAQVIAAARKSVK